MRIFLVLIIFISWFFTNPVFAEENDIGISKITPDSIFYFLKTVREDVELRLAFTPHVKLVRQLEFATRRLRETKSLVGTHEDLVQPTMERYWYHLSKVPVVDSATLITHLKVLQNLYGRLTNTQAKLSIRSTINKISNRLDLPTFAKIQICSFLQKEATSSALNQTEKAIFWERARDCFKETGRKI